MKKSAAKSGSKSAPARPVRQFRDMAKVAKGTRSEAGPDGQKGDVVRWPNGSLGYMRTNPRRVDGKWKTVVHFRGKGEEPGICWTIDCTWDGKAWQVPPVAPKKDAKGKVLKDDEGQPVPEWVKGEVQDTEIMAALGMKFGAEEKKAWKAALVRIEKRRVDAASERKAAKKGHGKKKGAKKGKPVKAAKVAKKPAKKAPVKAGAKAA